MTAKEESKYQASDYESDPESSGDEIFLAGVAELYMEKSRQDDQQAKRRSLAQRVRDCEMRLELAGPEQLQLCRQELQLAQSELIGFDLTPNVAQEVGPDLGPDLDWGR